MMETSPDQPRNEKTMQLYLYVLAFGSIILGVIAWLPRTEDEGASLLKSKKKRKDAVEKVLSEYGKFHDQLWLDMIAWKTEQEQ